jgi:uncharacterized protein (TIGR00369 family)
MSAETQLEKERHEELLASFANQGFLVRLGARIVDLAVGRCLIELPFGPDVTQHHGFFHGGAVGAIADAAGGYAGMTVLADGLGALTLEYKINFVRPAAGKKIVADAQVLRAGRSVMLTRVDVYAEGQSRYLCAAMQQTIMRAQQ